MQSKLKELLDKYIAEYDELREEYENLKTRKQLFKELMNYFNSGFDSIIDGKIIIDVLLDSIYHDDIYKKEFYKLLYKLINRTYDAESELQNFSGIIDKDYYTLNQRLLTLESRMNRIRKTVSSARVARIAIRVKNPIEANKYTLRDIEKIINYYELSGEITSKEAILCLNDLEFYNRNLTSETMQNKKEEEFAKEQYNNVPNILNAGYEVIEEPEVIIQRKEFLDKMVNEAINTLRYANKKEDIVRILENYERYDLENNEYNYIIIKVLNNISNELISYYNLLLEKDTYSFRRNRREIIEDYYMELNKYLIIRDYYDKYEDINKYKIGYNIGYTLKDGTSNNSTFLEPDIFRYSKYFYIYFYDDVNAPNGFYSHLENVNDNTLMTSVKLYAVDEIDEVESITLTAFTYDEDDFDKENNYRGNSKYTINIKRK